MTAKILGDDSLLMMDHFEEFLMRKVRIYEGIYVFNTALLLPINMDSHKNECGLRINDGGTSYQAPGGKEEAPFLAVLWLHTNHMPHPAMPEWYHAYTGVDGQVSTLIRTTHSALCEVRVRALTCDPQPAGDYLGTLSQMDQQVGRPAHVVP